MTAILATLLLALPAADAPAALVLHVKGKVEVRPAKGEPIAAKAKMLLYAGDRLIVPEGGEAALAFRDGGARERIKPGVEATVGAKGCAPASGVERREGNGAAVSASLRDIKPSREDGRAASATLRGGDDGCPGVTPIGGSTIASDRPDLAWPEAKGVKKYVVIVSTGLRKGGAGRELWRAESEEARIQFPEGKPALKRGYPFQWKVTDPDSRELACGDFIVAGQSQKKRLDDLAALAKGDDPDDLALAAEALERMDACAEAIAAYERLEKLAPDDASHREALARLRRREGR